MARHSVDVIVRARDQASKKFGKMGRAAGGMGRMIATAGASIATYFGVRQIGILLRYGAAFEKTMSRVGVLSRATTKDMKRLNKTAKELGKTTAFTASQVGEGMGFMALAGFEVNEIITAMPGVLNLAAAAQLELSESSDITAKILRGMGIAATDTGKVVDVLAVAFTTANTNLTQLGEAFKFVGPIGRTLSKGLEELTSAIQVMSDAGIQGQQAGTALRKILSDLSGGTPTAVQGFKELGVITTDLGGDLLPLADIIDKLNKSMEGMAKTEKLARLMKIFGQRAGPGMAAMLNEGGNALRDYEKQLINSTGSALKIATEQLNNVAGIWTQIQSIASGIIIDLYSQQSGFLTKFSLGIKTNFELLTIAINNTQESVDIAETAFTLSMVRMFGKIKHFATQVASKFPSTMAVDPFGVAGGSATFISDAMGRPGGEQKFVPYKPGPLETLLTELLDKKMTDLDTKLADALKKGVADIPPPKIIPPPPFTPIVSDLVKFLKGPGQGQGSLAAQESRFLTLRARSRVDYPKTTANNTKEQVRQQKETNGFLKRIAQATDPTGGFQLLPIKFL